MFKKRVISIVFLVLFCFPCFAGSEISKISAIGCDLSNDGCFIYLEENPNANPASCSQFGIFRWDSSKANSSLIFTLLLKAKDEQLPVQMWVSDINCHAHSPTIDWVRLD